MRSLVAGLLFASCASAQMGGEEAPHGPTPLPIMLERLSPEELAGIRALHDEDTSTSLIESRPILFQIQGVGDDQDQHRGPTRVNRPIDVVIYGFAERIDGRLVDEGWIERDGEVFWSMDVRNAAPAGGDARNLKFIDTLRFTPGRYTLRYRSNATHSNGGWMGAAPERPFYYGITVFNLLGLERVREQVLERP